MKLAGKGEKRGRKQTDTQRGERERIKKNKGPEKVRGGGLQKKLWKAVCEKRLPTSPS